MNPKNFLDSMPEVFVSTTEISKAVMRAHRQGSLRQIGSRVYTRNLRDPPEEIVRRHLWQLVSTLVPGALIADRTAMECRPAPDGSIFVVSDRKRDLELPGMIIRPRKGPPPVAGSDNPFIGGLYLSSEARACLDNLAPSRQRGGLSSRTLGRRELEARLEGKLRSHGPEALNKIRDLARQLAPTIEREAEFTILEQMISGLLGTHDAPLLTASGRARQVGKPYDPDRIHLFEALFHELRAMPPVTRRARDLGAEGRATLAFFEAYFSNFIEGTKFSVDKAVEIVFHGVIPQSRPADAHDVVGTWRVVADPHEMARTPTNPQMLLDLLRSRHATLMAARPDKHPGAFKVEDNMAGSTAFVAHELVEGTLVHGFELYRGLDTPFARAVYMMFLVSEVHPFTDGNGRTARIMMNAELVSAGEARIIIPTVFRENYWSALRALSLGEHSPRQLVRVLDFAQRWVAAVPWGEMSATTAALTQCHAFLESAEAEERGVTLRMPEGF